MFPCQKYVIGFYSKVLRIISSKPVIIKITYGGAKFVPLLLHKIFHQFQKYYFSVLLQ